MRPILTRATLLAAGIGSGEGESVPRLEFKLSLLLAPLAYGIHHSEEHLLFEFREWRLRYFADNNALSTEAVFIILTSITLLFILLHQRFENRATTYSILMFLMATQVVNAFFHVGGTIYFADFSPGLITGVLVYLPVNFLIARAALAEGLVSRGHLLLLFVVGACVFAMFEAVGPAPMLLVLIAQIGWIAWETRRAGATAQPA